MSLAQSTNPKSDAIDEYRATLEEIAERDDLRVSKYAKVLLQDAEPEAPGA